MHMSLGTPFMSKNLFAARLFRTNCVKNARIALNGATMTELRDVTYHMLFGVPQGSV